MENDVYYGEYSLRHWLDLILAKNIELPPYQRYYVWYEDQVKSLYNSLYKKEFVPTITIGAFDVNGHIHNYIIDGQQRLTSILLMYLGIFPDEKVYNKILKKYADENDENKPNLDNVMEWNFQTLTDKGNTKEQILAKLTAGNYKTLDMHIPEYFWNSTYLGFSYIVPDAHEKLAQQRLFSSIFRNINIQATPLNVQESRKALYFLDETLQGFFEPTINDLLSIKTSSSLQSGHMDFVRYMAFLSEYAKTQEIDKLATGYGRAIEEYYEEYVYSVAGQEKSDIFIDFEQVFPGKKYMEKLNKLESAINTLQLETSFTSIVTMDLYLFGLIYTTVFQNISADNIDSIKLNNMLEQKILDYKKPDRTDAWGNKYSGHIRNPGQLQNIRKRIEDSLDIYAHCINGN